jgi:hypothetical protein
MKRDWRPFIPLFAMGGFALLVVLVGICVFYFAHRLASRPTMTKQQAADVLMSALAAGEYPKAFEVLGKYDGAGRDFGRDPEEFQQWIESNAFQIKSWKWTREEEASRSTGRGANRVSLSSYTLYGAVVFSDGTAGTVVLKMSSFGLLYNPWRFEGISLKRDTSRA